MKIKKIKKILLEEPVPVYDITVPETHNFLLKSNIFVHNCTHIVYSAFTHPVQTNIMDLASSITKVERVALNGQQIKPAYYNSGKRVMSQRDATALAMKMFNR